nr:MAG: hypothetical protein [Bacteriophage sp.]
MYLMSLFINTQDKDKFIRNGFEYSISNINNKKYNRLKYIELDDGFDYIRLSAEWENGEETAPLIIESYNATYVTIPNIIINLISEGLLRKDE